MNRGQWWAGMGVVALTSLVFGLAFFLVAEPIALWVWYASMVVLTWIFVAVSAQRWHDLNQSGWWTMTVLIPVAGFVYVLWRLGFTDGISSQERVAGSER